MIKIDLLKNNPHAIPALASIWYEVLGKIWIPEIGIKEIESLYYQELNQNMPITYIALCGEIPVGSCTSELEGGIRADLKPWITQKSNVEPFYSIFCHYCFTKAPKDEIISFHCTKAYEVTSIKN